MKIRAVGAELFLADGRRDREDEANSRFDNFVNACIGYCWGNRREGDHWGDLGIHGWIILGWISRRWDVGMWTGLGWPRIETDGGRL